MSIKTIHLNTLLKAFQLPNNELTTFLRADIRREIAKENGGNTGGGDFYAPFWSDVKHHVAGNCDLHEETGRRIIANDRRNRLYPLLRDGFINWWDNKRRWRNEPFGFQPLRVKARYRIEELDAIVKVENLLGLSIGEQDNRLIYPYLYESPELNDQISRLGLWLLSTALSEYNKQDMRLLDVIRSNSYAVSDMSFQGTERAEFILNFERIINKWERLKSEYYS